MQSFCDFPVPSGRLRFGTPKGTNLEAGDVEPQAEVRWRKLVVLLEPFHEQALATARRLCRSIADGDDLYQDTVLRAYEKLHTLRDESRFRAWFYATLLNRHRTLHRRSFWRRFLPWEEAFQNADGPAGEAGEDRAERAVGAGRVARALATLPAVQREAVVLFDVEGHSIESIASMQGASIPAVKSRLARGRSKLKRWYERHGEAPSAVVLVKERSRA
jgi:RNA polymerase sigma-70 factor (ECF subfamily)